MCTYLPSHEAIYNFRDSDSIDIQSINQSINKFISRHSTEVRATVQLCQIKEKCLKTDLKCVNGCCYEPRETDDL